MTARVFKDVRTFPNNGALGKGVRVTVTGGFLAAAGLTQPEIGAMEELALAGDTIGSVRLMADTERRVAAGAISQYANVFRAANGQVSATGSGEVYGMALEAASGANSLIEVLPYRNTALGLGAITGGQRVATGQATTVGASDTIVTGLATVVAVVACLDADPTDDPEWVSASIGDQAGTPAAGSFFLKTWKNTGGTDPTPAAATTFTKKVNWIAIGT